MGRPTDRILIRRGTPYCCNLYEKIADNDIDIQVALDYLWSINTTTAIRTHRVAAFLYGVEYLIKQGIRKTALEEENGL